MKILTEKDKNKKVSFRRGEVFAVTLPSNPSTGFTWYLLVSQRDIWKLEKRTSKAASGTAVGAPGTETLTFRAMAEGGGYLRLMYLRSFEDQVDSSALWQVDITIKK